jgi:hypothetical protein
MRKTSFIIFLLVPVIFTACTSNEIGQSKDVSQEKIYQFYNIKYTEGDKNVTVFSQFRFAGKNGTTLVLSSPSQVSFDNEAIKADSGSFAGAFYQTVKPVEGFFGKHHFVFSDINNKKFDNDFSFDTFRLKNIPESALKNKDMQIPFESASLKDDDYIEVSTSGSDSSFSIRHNPSDGNMLTIPAKELLRQKGDELTLETTLYRSLPLQQNTAEGGVLEIRYALKAVKVKLTK